MQNYHCLALTLTLLFVASQVAASGGKEITDPQLKARSDRLSASTMIDGGGWQVYEELLHQDYSRWAMGEVYEGREKFVRSLEDWWNYGMRVATRDIEIIGVDISGDIAIIRFRTTETFSGPGGTSTGFSGYVSNVWLRENGDWMLLSAEISSLAR